MICGTVRAATFAADAMASTDCRIAAQVEQGYAGLLAPGGGLSLALTLLLTLYVAITGYRLVLGQSRLSLAESVPHFIKLGVVLALVSSWPSYQAAVVGLLFRAPGELANLIVARAAGTSGAPGEVLAALQQVFDRIADAAGDAWAQVPAAGAAIAPPGAPAGLGAPQVTALLLWASAGTMMAMSLGALLVARILLALLLLLGPVFIAAALFRGTRGLCEGWLRVTARFALVPLLVLPLTAVMLAAVAPFAARLGEAPVDSVRDGPALAILLIVLVFAAVLAQATRIAGTIAAGIRLPRGRARDEGPAAAAPLVLGPLPPPSRAATIVEAIAASDRRHRLAVEMLPSAVSARRSDPARPEPGVATPRLGQSYRRLAVTGARR